MSQHVLRLPSFAQTPRLAGVAQNPCLWQMIYVCLASFARNPCLWQGLWYTVVTTWCEQEALAGSARKLLTDVISNVSQKQAEPDYLLAGEKSELCIWLINAAVRCEGWVRAAIAILASCSFHRPSSFPTTMQQFQVQWQGKRIAREIGLLYLLCLPEARVLQW